MKKMMFNDRFGLTEAVIEKRKTVTRRLVKPIIDGVDQVGWKKCDYKVGEIVAIAQSYGDVLKQLPYWDYITSGIFEDNAGWTNKMFVKADLMPRKIRILNVRAEKLQAITDEDCLREYPECNTIMERHIDKAVSMGARAEDNQITKRDVFAWLIDKISGKGTWESNPFVWRIEFEYIN